MRKDWPIDHKKRDPSDDVVPFLVHGAANPTRTDDLLITSELLYQLSYSGKHFLLNCLLFEPKSSFFMLVRSIDLPEVYLFTPVPGQCQG